MKTRQTRKYEMLQRVSAFCSTHGDSFPTSSAAHEVFAALSAALDELAATDVMKISASVSSRADRKAAARKELSDLLMNVSQLARVFRARGRTIPPFEIPESRSDQTLLTVARQFARDAGTLDAEFTGHGMGPTHIATLTSRFEEAMRDRGMNRAGHVAARTRIQELLSQSLLDVRRLDLIIDNELRHDPVIQAVWEQARRVLKTGATGGEPASATASASATATADGSADGPASGEAATGTPESTAAPAPRAA